MGRWGTCFNGGASGDLAVMSDFWQGKNVDAILEPIQLHTPESLKWDDENLFEFCQLNRDYRIERNAEGDILIMSPEAASSGSGNMRLAWLFAEWAERDGSGRAFGSSTGFILANKAMRSPDVSWVSKKRLQSISQQDWNRFLPLCPDFVLELRSPSDRLRTLQEKMQEYIDNGASMGWLLDPEAKQVHVYRPGSPVEVLNDPATVSGEPVLPKFALEVPRVWTAMELG
jgi:Uma2 family endonuclease